MCNTMVACAGQSLGWVDAVQALQSLAFAASGPHHWLDDSHEGSLGGLCLCSSRPLQSAGAVCEKGGLQLPWRAALGSPPRASARSTRSACCLQVRGRPGVLHTACCFTLASWQHSYQVHGSKKLLAALRHHRLAGRLRHLWGWHCCHGMERPAWLPSGQTARQLCEASGSWSAWVSRRCLAATLWACRPICPPSSLQHCLVSLSNELGKQ